MYISSDLDTATSPLAAALPEIRARLRDNTSQLIVHDSPVSNLIRFKRHVQARYDPWAKKWIPLDSAFWEWESTCVIVAMAEEIVDYATTGRLSDWVADIQLQLGPGQLILLVKDLKRYNDKTRVLANREFAAAVRGTAAPTSRRPSRDVIEDAMTSVQLLHRCHFVHGEFGSGRANGSGED